MTHDNGNGNGNGRGPDKLYAIIAGVLGVAPAELSDDSSPDTVSSWDSLNHLNLIMAVEGEFGIGLSPEDAMEMSNVALIRTVLRDHGVEV